MAAHAVEYLDRRRPRPPVRYAAFGSMLALVASLAPVAAVGQSRFDQIRDEVRRAESAPAQPTRSGSSICRHGNHADSCPFCDRDDDDNVVGNLLGEILVGVFTSDPNSDTEHDVHYQLRDDTISDDPYFAHYPYADGLDGYVMEPDWVPARPQTGAVRFRMLYGNDFDGIDSWGGDLLLEGSSGWGFDVEYTWHRERLSSGGHDEMQLGDANLLYRFARYRHLILRGGLGVGVFDDDVQTDLGFNGTFLVDWFPRRPWVGSTEIDVGTLGSASHVHVQSTIGLNWEHIEVFAGYDYRRIGSVNLDGPLFGLRGWW